MDNTFGLSESFTEEFELQLNQVRRFTSHGPTIGRFVEILFLSLCKKYFPKQFDFSSGFIHCMHPAAKDRSSPQIDIICFDRYKYPVLLDSAEFVVVPAKSVKGMIEIKSTMTKASIHQITNLTKGEFVREVSGGARAFLLSTRSSIKPETAFRYLKNYYESKPEMNKFIGAVYSLDWNEILWFSAIQKGRDIDYSGSRLDIRKSGIAPFMTKLLFDIYGEDACLSIANSLSPVVFKMKDRFSIPLGTNVENFCNFSE